MNELERELRRELQEFAVPQGFSERVMKRVRQREMEARTRTWHRAVAAVVLLCAGAGGVTLGYEREQQEKAVVARHEFAVAMQVTGKSLGRAMARIDRTNKQEKGEAR